MNTSQIGTILLGTGVLFIALLLQQEYSTMYDGFQDSQTTATPDVIPDPSTTAAAASPPPPPDSTTAAPVPVVATASPPPSSPSPTVSIAESVNPAIMSPAAVTMYNSAKAATEADNISKKSGSGSKPDSKSTQDYRFSLKDAEIQDMFNMIKSNKVVKDKTLSLVLDSEEFHKIDVLYLEISNYLDMNSMASKIYDKDSLYQVQMIVFEQVKILYNIYVTMPSMVVATNLIVDTANATLDSLNDPSVITETKDAVTALLAPMPTATQKIASYEQILLTNFKAIIENPSNNDQITQFNKVFAKYKKLVDLQLKSYTTTVTTSSVIDSSNMLVVNTLNSGIKLVISVNRFLLSLSKQLKALPPSSMNATIQSLIQTLESTAEAYETKKASVLGIMESNKIPIKEAFQSYQNSYNAPSLSQAHEFRLSKRTLLDEVFAFMK